MKDSFKCLLSTELPLTVSCAAQRSGPASVARSGLARLGGIQQSVGRARLKMAQLMGEAGAVRARRSAIQWDQSTVTSHQSTTCVCCRDLMSAVSNLSRSLSDFAEERHKATEHFIKPFFQIWLEKSLFAWSSLITS